jgi:hypothetical protein
MKHDPEFEKFLRNDDLLTCIPLVIIVAVIVVRLLIN